MKLLEKYERPVSTFQSNADIDNIHFLEYLSVKYPMRSPQRENTTVYIVPEIKLYWISDKFIASVIFEKDVVPTFK
jgi:hypothetical protein